jgi:putative NIF3 family GTP cyclohydrolase 1 type 2
MTADDLYLKLDADFAVTSMRDDWSFMRYNDYISPRFKERYIGVMLDNTPVIKKVFTATIPDIEILDKIIQSNQSDALLFSHHAMGYDPTMQGFPFYDIPEEYLIKLKQQRISFYVMHVPLDKNGEFSTSVSLARHLNLEITGEFCEYEGVNVGVICNTESKTATELTAFISTAVGHEVKLIRHGDDLIMNNRVAVAAGGGNVGFAAKEVTELGINLYVTGCTRDVPSFGPVNEFHRIIEKEKINVIGATHYTTEKYACIAMVRYFEALGIPAEYLEGIYYLEDL